MNNNQDFVANLEGEEVMKFDSGNTTNMVGESARLEDPDIVEVNTGNEILVVSTALGAQWGVLALQNEFIALPSVALDAPNLDEEKINEIREKVRQTQASSAPNLRPHIARTRNPKYFNDDFINPTNLKTSLNIREKCDSEPEGGVTSPSAFEEARLYGGIVGGVHVDPWAPMADSGNLEDYYDEEDGFQKVKGKRGKSGSKARTKNIKPKRPWNYRRQFDLPS